MIALSSVKSGPPKRPACWPVMMTTVRGSARRAASRARRRAPHGAPADPRGRARSQPANPGGVAARDGVGPRPRGRRGSREEIAAPDRTRTRSRRQSVESRESANVDGQSRRRWAWLWCRTAPRGIVSDCLQTVTDNRQSTGRHVQASRSRHSSHAIWARLTAQNVCSGPPRNGATKTAAKLRLKPFVDAEPHVALGWFAQARVRMRKHPCPGTTCLWTIGPGVRVPPRGWPCSPPAAGLFSHSPLPTSGSTPA